MGTNSIYKLGIVSNELIIAEKTLSFKYPIDKLLEVSDTLIVLLNVPPKTVYNSNVFGISLTEKNIKWQISIHNLRTLSSETCPFTNILIYKGKLRLNNWCDFYLIVDPSTGEVLEDEEFR